ATEVIILANDILSLGKDMVTGWPNVITVIERERGLSMPDALEQAVEMHNVAVRRFLEREKDLPAFGGDAGTLARIYVDRLHFVIRGFTEFESSAERYRRMHVHAAARGAALVTLRSFVEE